MKILALNVQKLRVHTHPNVFLYAQRKLGILVIDGVFFDYKWYNGNSP